MPPRVILITGANSGIGFATVEALVSASSPDNHDHILLTARTLAKAQAAVSSIQASHPASSSHLIPLELDVTSPATIERAAAFVSTTYGHLDCLINNAGISSGNAGSDIHSRYHATFSTNAIGPAVVSDHFRPLLHKSPNPYSIYVSSGAGSFTRNLERFNNQRERPREPETPGPYHASKAAMNMIALQEHIMYADQGLKVFVVSPGFVVSGLRGESEELRTGWGKAEPAEKAGRFLVSILRGERDEDVGKFLYEGGLYDW